MPTSESFLSTDIARLKGISARRVQLLHKLNIYSYGDLLRFYPRAYEDWTQAILIAQFEAGKEETFIAQVGRQPVLFRRGKLTTLRTRLCDESGCIQAIWFNQPYLEERLQKGSVFIFRGKIKAGKHGLEIHNPAMELPSPMNRQEPLLRLKDEVEAAICPEDEIEAGGRPEETTEGFMKAIYPLTAGLTQGVIRMLIAELLSIVGDDGQEILPAHVRQKHKLCTAAFATEQIHRPRNQENLELARRRLVFEELFMLQLALRMLHQRRATEKNAAAIRFTRDSLEEYRAVTAKLPFELTHSQQKALNEVAVDLARQRPMSRLIQGDVGSGKTIVAGLAMLQVKLSGHQSVLMAPTSVLAVQHFMTLREQLASADLRIALLTGQTKAAERRKILQGLQDGEIDILVGTHAVIQDKVLFRNLALAVTDEQHRFGVKQRVKLAEENDSSPHVMVMSATPIPRSLALILYGDLDISILHEKPAGRMPIITYTATKADLPEIERRMEESMRSGAQIYVICPLVKEGENELDLESVEKTYEELRLRFADHTIALLHGSMKEKEKREVMAAFYRGTVELLVSTTVVEVGVDNPRATFMLIKNAERFGLAQLHQLRGRIGRGGRQSTCVLLSEQEEGLAKERMDTLCKTEDGFAIAEADLKLRGPGDFFGIRQHGLPELRIANLYTDALLLQESQEAAIALLAEDPALERVENRNVWPYLENNFGIRLAKMGL